MPDPSLRWRFQSPGDRRRRRARFRPSERGEDNHEESELLQRNASDGIGVSAARFLLGPRSSPLRRGSLATATSVSPLPRRHHHQHQAHSSSASDATTGPFYTLALLKLEQIFPDFCLPLAQASLENITRACTVMDSSLATVNATNSNQSHHHSPNSSGIGGGGSPKSPQSPASMGFLHWLPDAATPKRGRSLSPPTTATSAAALALEGEWDKLLRGFLVLSTAEYLYQDVQQLKRGHSLRGLFEYVAGQLEHIHATLCEPFLSIPTAATASRENKYILAARSVAQTLQCLLTVCQVRIQLIDVQSNLFTVGNIHEVKEAISTLLVFTSASLQEAKSNADDQRTESATSATTTTISAADPVKAALIQELKIWKHLLEACVGLERCDFFSSLISLRRCQTHMQLPARTRLEKWFDESCRILISLLPIYFDRVAAFCKPLYGFDPTPNRPPPPFFNWEDKVTEFLRKQEKAGGPPTAVAVILDALGADNLHVERGFQMGRKDSDCGELPERVLWPAVYLRSTTYLDHVSPQQVPHHGNRGSSAKFLGDWTASQTSGSEQSSSRIFGSSSTARNLDIDPKILKPRDHILEYGPSEGQATSWPHNDWTALVSLLELTPVSAVTSSNDLALAEETEESFRMAEELVAVTHRHCSENTTEVVESKWKPSLERAVRMFGVYANSETNAPVDAHAMRDHGKQRSTFHIVSLSKYLSMVVLVKEDEDSHFLRRRNPLTDEEIREFMNNMATHWNVTRRFSPESLPKALSTTRIELLHDEWDEAKIDDLIYKIKSSFGLRPTNKPMVEGHRGISFLGMNSPKKASRHAPVVEESESAATFFLGPELANLFDV